jgi:hypothetical protein
MQTEALKCPLSPSFPFFLSFPDPVQTAGNDAWERHNDALHSVSFDAGITSSDLITMFSGSALWTLLQDRNELRCLVRDFTQSLLTCDGAVSIGYLWTLQSEERRRFFALQGLMENDFVEAEDWRSE